MNNNRKKKLFVVLILLLISFLAIVLYMTYFQIFKAEFYANHKFNARNWVDESRVMRGEILDRKGNTLAYSQKEKDKGIKRYYTYDYLYSPIIGYSSKELGNTGIEQSFNRELLNITTNSDFITRLEGIYKQSDKGKDVYLTIDSDIQSYMYNLLNGYRGAIIVSDPETGDIIAMVSRPTYNVNNLKKDWDKLISSNNGVMINRASQGLYTPGSIFKLVSSIVFLENDIDLDYNDEGSTVINGYKISNYKNRAYGDISLREALMHSSNAYFADKSKLVTNSDFQKVIDNLMIGGKYPFDLAKSDSRTYFSKNIDELEKAVTAFGQGKTMVTPLDMSNLISAVANDGVMMQPRIVNKTSLDGSESIISEKTLSKAIDRSINDKLKDYLESTAKSNKVVLRNGKALAGKTGTAEVEDTSNLWYIGYGPADRPKYAVTVVLEDTGLENGHKAKELFIRAMNYLLIDKEDS